MSADPFDSWALVELFGHQRIVGRVTEATIGGCSFLRVDVPEGAEGEAAYTRFYGQGAIYAMSPVTEDVARNLLTRVRPEPVAQWMPYEKPALQRIGEQAVPCDGCGDHWPLDEMEHHEDAENLCPNCAPGGDG